MLILTAQDNARIATGIALILIVIAVLALAGHASVVDQGVNSAGALGRSVDDTRRSAVKGAKTVAETAAVAA